METLDRQDNLFAQEWITTFVTAGDLLRRDGTRVEPTLGPPMEDLDTTTPYDSWGWLD